MAKKTIKMTLITIFSLILLLALLVFVVMICFIATGTTLHIHPSPYQVDDEHLAFAIFAFFALIIKTFAIVAIVLLAKFMRAK